jgi:lysophospholipase L1-like esterase
VVSFGPVRAGGATPIVLLSVLATACGGGSPGGPGPVPTPTPGTPVTGFVFYDENANGIADPSELVRLPGAVVLVGGSSGQTTAGGRVTLSSVPAGAQAASLKPEELPAYFTPGAQVPVTVPQVAGTDLAVPATLAIGSRSRARTYMAFGDSITWGEGSNDVSGYRNYLEANLRSFWGGAHSVPNEGEPGTKSNKGESRMCGSLARVRPAYTLILYGTNDWNEPACKSRPPAECFTISALRSMIAQTRDYQSYAVLGTIPPVNPVYLDRQATERNEWVKSMNVAIRAMAMQEKVPVADIYDAYIKKGAQLETLFSDDLHPNEMGYAHMAQVWLRAITQPIGTSTSRRGLPDLFTSPGF